MPPITEKERIGIKFYQQNGGLGYGNKYPDIMYRVGDNGDIIYEEYPVSDAPYERNVIVPPPPAEVNS